MKDTADTFNRNPIYTGSGIKFKTDTKGFMRSNNIVSQTNGLKYHYEFWDFNDELYACIHASHNHLKNINLIDNLKKKSRLIKQYIEKNKNYGRPIDLKLCLPGWSGGGSPNETHTLNIKCLKSDPESNAALMHYLISGINLFKI